MQRMSTDPRTCQQGWFRAVFKATPNIQFLFFAAASLGLDDAARKGGAKNKNWRKAAVICFHNRWQGFRKSSPFARARGESQAAHMPLRWSLAEKLGAG